MTANIKKPQQLNTAINLLIISLVLGLINSVFSEITTKTRNLTSAIGLFSIIFTIAYMAFFIYYINLGKKWARNTYLILFIIGILVFPFSIKVIFKTSAIVGIVAVICSILQIVSLIMMYSEDCNQWFNNLSKGNSPSSPETNPTPRTISSPTGFGNNGEKNAAGSGSIKNNPIKPKGNNTPNSTEYQEGNPYS